MEGGQKPADVCRQHGINQGTLYVWKKRFAGLVLEALRELRQLREENGKLKRLVADLSLDRHILQEVLRKNSTMLLAVIMPFFTSAFRDCAISASHPLAPRRSRSSFIAFQSQESHRFSDHLRPGFRIKSG
jgi:putative transposase